MTHRADRCVGDAPYVSFVGWEGTGRGSVAEPTNYYATAGRAAPHFQHSVN